MTTTSKAAADFSESTPEIGVLNRVLLALELLKQNTPARSKRRRLMTQVMKRCWADPEFRRKQSETTKERWGNDPDFRLK
jgi:hypothetical protein